MQCFLPLLKITYLKNTQSSLQETPVLTLIWVVVILPPCWFSLNNSETVEALTLVFGIIQ